MIAMESRCVGCATRAADCSWSRRGDLGRRHGGGDCCPACVHPQSAESWCSAVEALADDPDAVWPEDVLTEAEWNRGWFDRQVIQGRMKPEERPTVECCVGGGDHSGNWCLCGGAASTEGP